MKAWPHTHIGIARDEYGLFIGTRFLGSSRSRTVLDDLLQYFPEAESVIIFPVEAATRWELEESSKEIKFTEWVEKGDHDQE